MHKCLQYLKVNGKYVDKGDLVDLSSLSAPEIVRLEKKGIVEEAEGTPKVKETEEKPVNLKEETGEEMSEDEVRAELLIKIPHSVAVRELGLLGAEFKKNASLETLIDIVVENEEYENHFFDYIDRNGL